MKKSILIFFLVGLFGFSCKKDKPLPPDFSKITRADVIAQEQKLTNNNIDIFDASVKAGTIIFYKTSSGFYGKMQVVSIQSPNHEYVLSFNFITYKDDGTVLAQGDNLTTSMAGAVIDLDTGAEVVDNTGDFRWDIFVEKTQITPLSTATYYVFFS